MRHEHLLALHLGRNLSSFAGDAMAITTKDSYLLECPNCDAMMGASVVATASYMSEDIGEPWLFSLVKCPKCRLVMVGEQEGDFNGGWDPPSRVWPEPPVALSHKIPKSVRESLEEAHRCLKAKAYTASVVMSGRALEAIGRHFFQANATGNRPLMLGAALDRLAKENIIDQRLYEWGRTLQADRNLAAHPSNSHFKEEDAVDVYKFVNSICDYIFVLSVDFAEYKKRREAVAKESQNSAKRETSGNVAEPSEFSRPE